ncbi:hypothetical protein [Reichenbachiella ulvae]|uniref:ApeI dehydratase-like domain-containing protein n=1 Tax=Reichenbachiella ulvae TaxID=2980104 RepID=A0ABT3CU83_9BACT|nr:hypothetical protein [Reichenbachiella ulvae]MCV9387179.1 hypothetical protein [Reichenbachiella ulvae]
MNKENFEKLISFGELVESEGQYEIALTIDSAHEVFKGHFPQQPVLPGVVTMEILRRAIEKATGKKVKLQKAANVKFLRMIDPTATPELVLSFNCAESEEGLKVKASLKAKEGEDIMFKQQATFDAA